MPADGSAESRSFLVSGGSGGIGQAVCEGLSAAGYRPIVGYHRSSEAAARVAKRVGGTSLALDLSQPSSITAALAALAAVPDLAGVVLAGSPPLSLAPFGKISPQELQEQWQVNVVGPQQLLAELVRHHFRKRKHGVVVGVLSKAMGEAGAPAAAGMGAYVIAKHGMAGLLALLAADYPWLRVRSVKPGYTETKMLEAFDERFLDMQRAQAPFQTPNQVASWILEEALSP